MKYVFRLLGLCVILLAISIPVTARAAELSEPAVGAYERGVAALEAGDRALALSELRSVSPRHERHSEALGLIAVELAEGELEPLAYANKALLSDPFSGPAWRRWGSVHLRALSSLR